jgi:hypothetical protein
VSEKFYCQFPACRKAPQARFKMCFAHRHFETSSTSTINQAWLSTQKNDSRRVTPTIAEADERSAETEMLGAFAALLCGLEPIATKQKKQTRKSKQSDVDFLRSCGIAP